MKKQLRLNIVLKALILGLFKIIENPKTISLFFNITRVNIERWVEQGLLCREHGGKKIKNRTRD